MPVGEPLLIRPRHAGDVLDQAALIVRRNFSQSLLAVVCGYLPAAVLIHLPLVPGSQEMAAGGFPSRELVYRQMVWLTVWLVGDILIARQFVRGWLLAIAGADLRGVAISPREGAAAGLRRLPATATDTLLTCGPLGLVLLLATSLALRDHSLILGAACAGPLLVLVQVPLALFGYCAVAVAVLERRNPWSALRRSFRLTSAGIGTAALTAVVLAIIRLFAGLMPSLAPNIWLQSVLYSASMSLLVILETAAEAVLYFTLRCRSEDYDLDLLAREVELHDADEVAAARPAFDRLTFGAGPFDHSPAQ